MQAQPGIKVKLRFQMSPAQCGEGVSLKPEQNYTRLLDTKRTSKSHITDKYARTRNTAVKCFSAVFLNSRTLSQTELTDTDSWMWRHIAFYYHLINRNNSMLIVVAIFFWLNETLPQLFLFTCL